MPPHQDALLLLQGFRSRALPSLLRRLRVWKGVAGAGQDFADDICQELVLDCLQHADEVLALPTRERHARWFRIAERCHYQQQVRGQRRRAPDASVEALVDGRTARVEIPTRDEPDPLRQLDLPGEQRRFLRRLSQHGDYLKNGKLNARSSARRLGMRAHDLTGVWDEVAEGLGFDGEFLAFWRRRLVEALVGLAADQLRDAGSVAIHDEERRRRPDPRGRLRRIAQVRSHLGWRPMPRDVKRVLSRYHSLRTLPDPAAILDDAALLLPGEPTVHLWRFEAAVVDRDLPMAARAIRAARRCGADPVRTLLARARLLQARGRPAAAARILARHPGDDPRIRVGLRCLGA